MIQYFLKEILESELPDLSWTVDYRNGDDEKATVYYEGGGGPDQYEVPTRYPNYMVYISSKDWNFAEYAAQKVVDVLHRAVGQSVAVDFKKDGEVIETKIFRLFMITAQGEPNDLGINEREIRDFSINFRATITETKEETDYGTRLR